MEGDRLAVRDGLADAPGAAAVLTKEEVERALAVYEKLSKCSELV